MVNFGRTISVQVSEAGTITFSILLRDSGQEEGRGRKEAAGSVDAQWSQRAEDTACPSSYAGSSDTPSLARDCPDLVFSQPTNQDNVNNMQIVTCLPLYSVTSTFSAYLNCRHPLYLSSLIKYHVQNLTAFVSACHTPCQALVLALRVLCKENTAT